MEFRIVKKWIEGKEQETAGYYPQYRYKYWPFWFSLKSYSTYDDWPVVCLYYSEALEAINRVRKSQARTLTNIYKV